MKKCLNLLLVLGLVAGMAAMVGCESDSDDSSSGGLAGNWELAQIGIAGIDLGLPLSSIDPRLFGASINVTMNANGSATVTIKIPDDLSLIGGVVDIDPAILAQIAGQTITINGRWEENGDRLTLTLVSSSVDGLLPEDLTRTATVGFVLNGNDLSIVVRSADLGLDGEFAGATLTLEFDRK